MNISNNSSYNPPYSFGAMNQSHQSLLRTPVLRNDTKCAHLSSPNTKSVFQDETRCVVPILKAPLPINFRPTPYSVIIGRGKKCTDAMGNRRLRVLASTILPEYQECTNKVDKTAVVTRLIDMVHEACPIGGFVRQIDNHWWEVDGHAAREKVGYVLRDLLHDKYRSSSKAKVARRRVERKTKRQSSVSSASSASSVSSLIGGPFYEVDADTHHRHQEEEEEVGKSQIEETYSKNMKKQQDDTNHDDDDDNVHDKTSDEIASCPTSLNTFIEEQNFGGQTVSSLIGGPIYDTEIFPNKNYSLEDEEKITPNIFSEHHHDHDHFFPIETITPITFSSSSSFLPQHNRRHTR